MLDFRKTVRKIIEAWNSDYPEDRINPDFADYSAAILRDRAEAQFSDGIERVEKD